MSHVTSVCFFHLRQLCLVRHSLTTDTAHALVRAKFTITWTTAMECLQVCQWVCSTVSSLYLGPLCDSSSAYQAVHRSCEQSVICFIGLVILSVSCLNLLDNLQMHARSGSTLHIPHQVLHTTLRRHWSCALAFCRSTQTVHPPHFYIDVWSTGILLIGPIVLERSSLAAS